MGALGWLLEHGLGYWEVLSVQMGISATSDNEKFLIPEKDIGVERTCKRRN